MTNYRRIRQPGATYFFTVNLADRDSDLLISQVSVLREARRSVQSRMKFRVEAVVVLPDHLHCIWTLPIDDTNYSGRWQAIKTAFSKGMPSGEHRSVSRIAKGERGIWQRRYWEHMIRDDGDYAAHADYIHFNPVKHGLVTDVAKWPFSSFHRWVARGIYPAAWCAGPGEAMAAGERDGNFHDEMPP